MSFAIASDLSEVIETSDGFGRFEPELEATQNLIGRLEAEKEDISAKLGKARRRFAYLRRKAAK